MSYCPSALSFSETHASKRIEVASAAFGEDVVKRLLAYALFLMGAQREDVARHVSMPVGTLLSFLTRIASDGLPAFEDRRQQRSEFLPAAEGEAPAIDAASSDSGILVRFGSDGPSVSIPASNPGQAKVFLLTLLENGLLERGEVAGLLGYSPTHTGRLARQLAEGDVAALLDKRHGQQTDYRVTPEVKAELIQQFAVEVITRGKASAEAVAAGLEERCQIHIPPRTVRYHLRRMGLPGLRRSLPELLSEVKKTSRKSS